MKSTGEAGSTTAPDEPRLGHKAGSPRLARCDLSACEALCCHDGAWLTPDDEHRIREAIRARPGDFTHLPKVKIQTVHTPTGSGRKTATRAWIYKQRPAHFTDTRCVFTLSDGRCSLQAAAEAAGLEPWTWKPLACWLHPLRLSAGEGILTVLPPAPPGQDPDATGGYPGYATFTPCGRHDPDGTSWPEALADELAWFGQRYEKV